MDIKHLARMKTDLKYMHTEISVLKQQIIDLVLLKFGKVMRVEIIDEHLEKKTFGDDIVNELMEALLRKMVHELRLSLADVKSLYKDELILWDVSMRKTFQKEVYVVVIILLSDRNCSTKFHIFAFNYSTLNNSTCIFRQKKLENAEIEYTEALRDNTARLDLLGLLKKEKLELSTQIANQDKVREMVRKRKNTAEEIDDELQNLKDILKKQEKQIDVSLNFFQAVLQLAQKANAD